MLTEHFPNAYIRTKNPSQSELPIEHCLTAWLGVLNASLGLPKCCRVGQIVKLEEQSRTSFNYHEPLVVIHDHSSISSRSVGE